MPSMRRLDMETLRTRRIIVTATLTVFMIAFLLLKETSAAVSATPPGAGFSLQAADERFPPDRTEAEQIPAGQTPDEAAAQDRDPGAFLTGNQVQTASTARPVRLQER